MTPRVVYTAGVFDLLHRGHLNMLWRSKRLGDVLVVGVVADMGVQAYKGRLPIEDTETRIANVARLSFVDLALPQETTDPSPNLRKYLPDIMTHGDDWLKLREGQETVEELGIEWVLVPYTEGISTTMLRG